MLKWLSAEELEDEVNIGCNDQDLDWENEEALKERLEIVERNICDLANAINKKKSRAQKKAETCTEDKWSCKPLFRLH